MAPLEVVYFYSPVSDASLAGKSNNFFYLRHELC